MYNDVLRVEDGSNLMDCSLIQVCLLVCFSKSVIKNSFNPLMLMQLLSF